MTTAISVAARGTAPRPSSAPRPATPAPSAAAYATKAGMTCAVLVPEGKIAMGKLSQAIAHGATLLQVDGNFDDCLTLARKLAEAYPVELVNSVNPARIEGQKTAAFEVVDALGDAPDIHCLPVGNAGNITAYWQGYREYRQRRRDARGRPRTGPADVGLPGRRRRADRPRPPGRPPRDHRHRDPDRQPRLVAAGRGGPRRVRRPDRARSPTSRSSPRTASCPPREGIFVEPASAASVAGLLAGRTRPGWSRPAPRIVCTVTGHGLKDPQWALADADGVRGRSPTRVPVDAFTAAGGPRPRGLTVARRWPAGSPPGVRGPGARAPAPTSARASTRSGWPSASGTTCRATVTERPGLGSSRSRARAPGRCRATSTHLVAPRDAARPGRRSASQPPGGPARSAAATTVPHGRGLGSSATAIVAGSRCGTRHFTTLRPAVPTDDVAGRPRLRQRPRRRRSRATPTTRRPACYGGLTLVLDATTTVAGTHDRAPARAPRRRRRSSSCPAAQLSTATARVGAARRRCATRDAAAQLGRAALLVARPRRRRPELLLAATRDWLHQEAAARVATPQSMALVDALRAAGHAAVVSGAGPRVLVLATAATSVAEVARPGRRRGWRVLDARHPAARRERRRCYVDG